MIADDELILMDFGFTQTESLLYYQLLKTAPASGYKLAQSIGRAPPNVYQALKNLTYKGAVMAVEAPNVATSYVPVPPSQLLAVIDREHQDRTKRAMVALNKIQRPAAEVMVSQLHTVPQVLQQARSMIGRAKEIIAFDMMPGIYDLLSSDIEQAGVMGVQLAGLVYRAADATGNVIFSPEAAKGVHDRWPGHGFILVTDGRELMIGLLSKDMSTVVNAVYADSVFLSCMVHFTLASTIQLISLQKDMADHSGNKSPAFNPSLTGHLPPGMREMMNLSHSIDQS